MPCTRDRSTDFVIATAFILITNPSTGLSDVLQAQRAKLLERQIEPVLHMVPHLS